MKYLNEERFIVNSNDKDSRRKYNENYDRIFGEKTEPKKCTGYYDDGVMPTSCQNREGCGLKGCPAADFGNTYNNPSVEAVERGKAAFVEAWHEVDAAIGLQPAGVEIGHGCPLCADDGLICFIDRDERVFTCEAYDRTSRYHLFDDVV